MRPVVILICSFLCGTVLPAAGSDWTLIKHRGHDHVTFKNVSDFYGLDTMTRVKNDVSLRTSSRSLRGQLGSNEFFINNLKFILTHPIAEADGQLIISRMDLTKVIEPVMRPSQIRHADKVDTIILDPGHGGTDNGARSVWGNEKSYALDVAFRTRELLQQNGFKVYLTRTSDVFVPLEERVNFANQFDNALFISIHFNSSSSGTGVETYTLAPRGVPSMAGDGPRHSDLQACPGNARDAENMALATATHASVVLRGQLPDRGIKRARFVVIRDIAIPGVLIEGGFLSNPNDGRKVANPAYRQQMACCLLQAVQLYRSSVGTFPPPESLLASQPPASRVGVERTPGETKLDEPVVITPTTN